MKSIKPRPISTEKRELRIGIVGIGNMGLAHARNIHGGKIPRLRLTAVCDTDPARLQFVGGIKSFTDHRALIGSGEIDALLIATPHYSHTSIGIDALAQGLHVLVEKPISVHKNDCEKLIAAHQGGRKQIFGAMFNQRTDPFYQKIRALIANGELGEIQRVNWIITNWFRPDVYYASGGWRATWAGEGGGVLLNQCPHNLDLFQWMFGMPRRVRAFCRFGRYHDIEVDDEVTAYMEFKNGGSGVFITTTGEAPGTNRLEISGDRGKLVYEDDTLIFTRNEVPTSVFTRETPGPFSSPPTWHVRIAVSGHGDQHNGILRNFTDAALDGAPLLAPAPEGIHSVELANAMIFSTLINDTVELPLDGQAYERQLKKLIAKSKPKKKTAAISVAGDAFEKSFK